MSGTPSKVDQTVTLLKIQALLASAYELAGHTGNMSSRTDMKFLSYLIKMARMEVTACFEKPGPAQSNSENRDNLDRM